MDKVEPKFHKGEWIITKANNLYKITAIIDDKYQLKYGDNYTVQKCADVDKNARLWNIQDAKPGDVLHSIGFHSDFIFIFNGLDNWKFDEPDGERAVATGYCSLTLSADNMEFGIQGPDCIEVDTVKPATNKQRDLLFQKMKEAGYEFDFEKKELKKISSPVLSSSSNIGKIEPKFHECDLVVDNCGYVWKIEGITNRFYLLEGVEGGESRPIIEWVNKTFHLWTIEDAKDGDVLANDISVFIYAKVLHSMPYAYCGVDKFGVFKDNCLKNNWSNRVDNIHPATKEQRDLLFQKMEEAGYEWDADEKELRVIEYNGEDYGIDSLYHAQRILEKTLGKVDGYQTDDGILAHKCAITVLKRLYEHKPIGWAQDNVKELNEFENAMLHVGMSFFGKNADLSPNDTDDVREQAKLLLGLAKTNEWSEEDSARLQRIADFLWKNRKGDTDTIYQQEQDANWLKSLESKCGYNPYKAVVESIAKMCDKYEPCASDEAQMRDFLCNVKAKCHEAVEYDKKYCQN